MVSHICKSVNKICELSSILSLPELSQIVEEFQLRCGSTSERINKEVFSTLMTALGYPAHLCLQCFK